MQFTITFPRRSENAKDATAKRLAVRPGMTAINAGDIDMLDMATRSYYPATVHRVFNPPAARNVAHFSMPIFLHVPGSR
jgi:isopenicillin N synthase-like dioxygenase